jgi:hypothetical protein
MNALVAREDNFDILRGKPEQHIRGPNDHGQPRERWAVCILPVVPVPNHQIRPVTDIAQNNITQANGVVEPFVLNSSVLF